jgi:hypothetical protein
VKKVLVLVCLATACALFMIPATAFAQSDEIQVYDGSLAEVGVFNLTWHNNYTPSGIKQPSVPGGVTSDKSFNGVTEWAYGVTTWFEAGLYLPLYTHDKDLGFGIDGYKLRSLFAVPNADERRFVYAANFEFSVNAKRWDASHFTSEVRPIVGWHVNPKFDLFFNPILDTAYDGLKNLTFAPEMRIAYNPTNAWSLAFETYSDLGLVSGFAKPADQAHQLFGVVDRRTKGGLEVEVGVGVGITEASDRLTLKFDLARDLSRAKKKSK